MHNEGSSTLTEISSTVTNNLFIFDKNSTVLIVLKVLNEYCDDDYDELTLQ